MIDSEGVIRDPAVRLVGPDKLFACGAAMNSRLQSNEKEMLTQDEILPECEGRQSLYDWNDTHAVVPDACVHELFEQQVARNPGAVAVTCKQRQLSYQELNQRANQMARYLRQRGVGPESLVGVCLERSLELMIALLGVWKAGGAYLPLDPAYPKDRLSFMVGDTGMKVLLTDEKCKSLFPPAIHHAICVDADWPVIALEKTDNLATTAKPSNLAYVMYTSGSTGQPKGVMIQHDGLVNYLCWAIKTYEVEGAGSVPVHSSIAFDSTVASLYPPLLIGAQIELLPEDVAAQQLLAALHRVKNRSKVVVTPTHLELLNHQISPEDLGGITKVLVIAGETLTAEKLSNWRDFAPATRLFNEYGPTETTVGCCAYEVQATDSRHGPVPIGRPITHAQLYVLDSNMHPVLAGMIGELYVGGAGVARGYLNNPQLTRERFLDDPFSGRTGARLYKTGDLVRFRLDATLEFLGRVDDQVKIRGYRIELGEIESTLSAHPGVQSCTVLTREDIPGNKQLVAYLVAHHRESLDAENVRNFLKRKLPDYMVPAYFVFLDCFPLTQNGKIDRKALPAPSHKDTHAAMEFVLPRTQAEKKLVAIWMELLEVERIGIYDDLFELGAHSLLAIRALSKIEEVFEVRLSMRTLFPTATIARLAEALESPAESTDRLAYAMAAQVSGKEPSFHWIGTGAQVNSLASQLGPNQPLFGVGFEPQIVDRIKAPYRLEEIAKHLVLAIREKQPQGPYRLGGFCMGAVLAYEVARQLTMHGQDVALLVLFEPLNPLQSASIRFATSLRRMSIRIGYRFGELRRLRIGEFPVYARSRWNGLKSLSTDMVWRISARSQILQRQVCSPDLEKILFIASSSYEPKPLGNPTAIFRCKDWPMLSAGDPYFGWREFLTGRSETHEIPGDHSDMFSGPNLNALAEKLRICLQNARRADMPSETMIVHGAQTP
jgi:amino acid adenylation domain-containing protein